ncbi:MAG: methionine synthase, partial [Lachnospira sp.]|nr:methionine synthase [Lachnospira sp.]
MSNIIELEHLNRAEALRYMGCVSGTDMTDAAIVNLMDTGERKLLSTARPGYIYKAFETELCNQGVALKGTNLVLFGESIKEHLKDCKKAVLMAVTISADVDRLLRVTQLENMAEAVVIDSLASVAVEQVCDKVEEKIKEEFMSGYMTFRFGVGYGDFPITQQKDFVKVLQADKYIGLHVTSSGILTPTKSVTAVIGLSEKETEQ